MAEGSGVPAQGAGESRSTKRGGRSTTLADVAAEVGVSVSAVSTVLSNHPESRVSAATAARIRAAAQELKYRPNFAGRALKSARTRVLGLVVPDLTNALFTELMLGAEDEARQHGYTLLLGRADGPMDDDVIERLIGEGRVDGVIIQVDDGVPPGRLLDHVGPGAAVILINSRTDTHKGSVVLNDEVGARIATEHLIALGHERIAFANGLPKSFTAARRQVGWVNAMDGAGLSITAGYETRLGYRFDEGVMAMRVFAALDDPPTGIVVANVNAAVGVLAEARRMGMSVPTDLSVVTIHDSWTGQHTYSPLTAVNMHFYEMGRTAARQLIGLIDNGTATDIEIDDPLPELIVRESSGPPTTGGRTRRAS